MFIQAIQATTVAPSTFINFATFRGWPYLALRYILPIG
jgi:hypothetical protein